MRVKLDFWDIEDCIFTIDIDAVPRIGEMVNADIFLTAKQRKLICKEYEIHEDEIQLKVRNVMLNKDKDGYFYEVDIEQSIDEMLSDLSHYFDNPFGGDDDDFDDEPPMGVIRDIN